MKISIALCEGAHDIAFVSKILYSFGFKSYENSVSKFPKPLNHLFIETFGNEDISDRKLGFREDSYLIPRAALIRDEHLVLFHNMNSDTTTGPRYRVIDQYSKLFSSKASQFIQGALTFDAEYILFYDADELGVEGRVEFIKDKFCDRYSLDANKLKHGVKLEGGIIKFGCYVFHDERSGKGTLENELIRMIESKDDADKSVLSNAEAFIEGNSLAEQRTKKYCPINNCYVRSSRFSRDKAIISLMGQMQFSGASNSVIIANSDYIKKNDIINCSKCKMIAALFS